MTQELPPRRKYQRQEKPSARPAADSSGAATRRALLLAAIGKSDIGLTLSELRKASPKMDGKDRSNAIQGLKAAGQIVRKGNTWMAASAR